MKLGLIFFPAFFLDLLKHYDDLIPPTLVKKKRESERKAPVRKRTTLVDMRLSRSRISTDADARQLLAAQQIAQNPSLAPKSVKSPELPPVPLPTVVPDTQQPLPPPASVSKPITPPPPPAVVASFVPPPPPPPLAASEDSDLHRPKFKDPTPEFDGLPPRPSFKEPPPESDDLPTRPTFTDLAQERFDVPLSSPPPPSTSVTAPTPQKRASGQYTPSKIASRSPSPADNSDLVLGSGKTTILRSGSAQSSTMRGPRYPRNARGTGGSNVQNLVQNLNRTGSPPNPHRLSGNAIKRPSSVVGRSAAALSRRSMVSEVDDDVADRK